MPCSDVVDYRRFRGPCCLHLHGDGGSMDPPKRWIPTTTIRFATTQKTSTWNITAMKAPELATLVVFALWPVKFAYLSHNSGNVILRVKWTSQYMTVNFALFLFLRIINVKLIHRLSWNFVWSLLQWKQLHIFNFQFHSIGNTNMAVIRTAEIGASFTLRPWNLVLSAFV